METEKQIFEQKVFEWLDANCQPYSTPLPNKFIDMYLKCEIFGFMSRMISEAFENMRESKGKSNWECDAKKAIGSKISKKRVMTVNSIRKYLMECQGADLIEYSKEVGDEIIIKINVGLIFEDCPGVSK